jgi:hypothetical protein
MLRPGLLALPSTLTGPLLPTARRPKTR